MVSLILCAVFFFGCGSATDSGEPGVDTVMPAQDIGELTPLEKLIYTESYAGYLVVHLSAPQDDPSKLSISVYPPSEKITDMIRPVIEAHPVVQLKRSMETLSEEQIDARRFYLQGISGKQLTDFNLIYHVEVTDPDEAVRVMRELAATEGVEKVYPKRKTYVAGLATVPDLTGQQGYLYPDSTHGGLNAQAAWTAGVKGQGVVVFDDENDWNFGHEDLSLDWPTDAWGGSACYPTVYPECVAGLAHGTAVAGIIGSLENAHGTTGFVPQADLITGGGGMVAGIEYFLDGVGDFQSKNELPPGTIFVIETQHAGKLSPDGFCSGFTDADQYGCVAIETDPEEFAAIEYATTAGLTVVEGAGNGSVDLSDPATYWPYEMNLAQHDSGSILVGGSQGANHQKISFSNCGSPVRSYAWAQGVVTTAYPYGGSTGPYYWTPTGTNDPPNDDNNAYFTNRFGGTSSATAMVAGAAALVQSYTKSVTGQPTRYLMPLKMREALVSTGVSQSGAGCTIGKQPRIDQAMAAVNTFWNTIKLQYPELVSGGSLTVNDMLALRSMGLGIMCGSLNAETHEIEGPNDPVCPAIELWPPGTKIAKSLDFDGDDRADLVSWTNGQWKIDLSSVGTGGDNYGAWDLVINYPPIQSKWVWPYVEDYNSDGREDFAVYDKEHGKWYIAFTDSALLSTGMWHGWDWVIDYSAYWTDDLKMDPWQSNYSRPLPGDYNGDTWTDIAIACSDGYWRIDFGGPNRADYGTFDRVVQYLSPEQLAQAPGWAYPIVRGLSSTVIPSTRIAYKVPDGLTDPNGFNVEGRLVVYYLKADGTLQRVSTNFQPIFGGNHYVAFIHDLGMGFSTKNGGTWEISSDGLTLDPVPPQGMWGKMDCRPIVADFDGDLLDDRAVMCPDEWRIGYSSTGTLRTISLGYDIGEWTLPGRSYSGGVNYSFAQQLIAYAQETNPNEPAPIPVDMVSVGVCSLPVSGTQDECN